MKKLTQSLVFISLFFTSTLLAQNSEFPGMPANIEAELRDIGAVIEVQRTTALYAPSFGAEPYEGKAVSRNLAYGSHERHVLDVFTTPEAGSGKPVVIFMHGGGFRGGAKAAPGSAFYDNIMNWAVDSGMVGVNINYRLSPEFQWPSGIEDLTEVVAWVRDNIAVYGGDPELIFLWGHSAGAAHVGDYVGWQATHNLNDGIAGAILTSGFYKLGPDVSMWSVYYGDNLTTYAERSSLPGLLKTSTPIFANDAELDPPTFPGTRELSAAFAEANKPLTRITLKGHSHISETYAIGTVDQSLSGPVKEFIQNISNSE